LRRRRLTADGIDVFPAAGGRVTRTDLRVSFPAFHQSGSFPIKSGRIYPAGLQIKFVDDDLYQRRSSYRKKQSQ